MSRYDELVAEALTRVKEILPWDLSRLLASGCKPILLDVREPAEFMSLRIPGAINVPRGILEQSCEWDYDETVPLLADGRNQDIVVICRSGKRSVLAADTMQRMGFVGVVSLKTGVRGWIDFEQAMVDANGAALDADAAEALLEGLTDLGTRNEARVQQARFSERTDFSELKATFNIKEGRSLANSFDMRSPLFRIAGEGDLALDSGSVGYRLTAAVGSGLNRRGAGELAELKGAAVPIRVSGDIVSKRLAAKAAAKQAVAPRKPPAKKRATKAIKK